jgi:2-oxoglutarate dehydrogenase E1 component
VREGIVAEEEAAKLQKAVSDNLQAAKDAKPSLALLSAAIKANAHRKYRRFETAVPAERLKALNEALLFRPTGFSVNPKLEQILQRRRRGLLAERGIDWGHAESLAFASILEDGTPIRLTGQDAERGTFGSRHSVLHDPVTGARFIPLQALPQATASFAAYNSPLSENAALGFEYGYSVHATEALVLWEAQFGDFANGAQVIIDQFLVSGYAKWQQTPSLVLLLPHGYEGSGPEHSSGRVERYLQLAANDNIRVVNCTTAAQYFHVLRRQAALLKAFPRPLIIMTPKSLLRKSEAGSSLADLTSGTFQRVLCAPMPEERSERITRLVLCSGKVYYDLVLSKPFAASENVAVARIEQLYPFPASDVAEIIERFPNLHDIAWLQEEPHNMGAWTYLSDRIYTLARDRKVLYIGRRECASPSEGSAPRHEMEQARIVAAALTDVPRAKKNGHRPSTRAVVAEPETTLKRSAATNAV